MKKLAIFLAIMLIPFSAFALDTISDSDLDSVTGQAGVSIFTNSIQITRDAVTTTYTDLDGADNTYVGTPSAGNFSIVSGQDVRQIFFNGYDPINVDVVDRDDAIAIINNAARVGALSRTFFGEASELNGIAIGTSDVATPGATDVFSAPNYATDELGESGVQITLPNQIVINNISTQKTYYATDAAGIAAGEESMIQITTTGGSTTYGLALMTPEQQANTLLQIATGTDGTASSYVNFCSDAAWTNALDGGLNDSMAAVGIDHADQIKILITSHD